MYVGRVSTLRLAKSSLDGDALTVALVLVPSFVSRNRQYALFADDVVRSARTRARLVRSILLHLSGSLGPATAIRVVPRAGGYSVSFELRVIGFARSVWLTAVERAVLGYAGQRAGLAQVPSDPSDHAQVRAALARLPSVSFGPGPELAEASVG
jgi:hypothetical protein